MRYVWVISAVVLLCVMVGVFQRVPSPASADSPYSRLSEDEMSLIIGGSCNQDTYESNNATDGCSSAPKYTSFYSDPPKSAWNDWVTSAAYNEDDNCVYNPFGSCLFDSECVKNYIWDPQGDCDPNGYEFHFMCRCEGSPRDPSTDPKCVEVSGYEDCAVVVKWCNCKMVFLWEKVCVTDTRYCGEQYLCEDFTTN